MKLFTASWRCWCLCCCQAQAAGQQLKQGVSVCAKVHSLAEQLQVVMVAEVLGQVGGVAVC